MYRYLLCWRYLRSRWIALASIVSVMLGVATMIVVNAVMAGFAERMKDRLHGILSDVVVESRNLDGFEHPEEVIARIRGIAGDRIEAVAAATELYALLTYYVGDQPVTRQVQLIGVDPVERAKTGEFAEFLKDEQGQSIPPSFEVTEELRKRSPAGRLLSTIEPDDPFAAALEQDVEVQVPRHGAILGYALATWHRPDTRSDVFLAPQGTRAILTFPTAGKRPKPASDAFTVVGYFQSGMSEYDSMQVYVPLERIQAIRQAGDRVNQVQLKVRPGVDLDRLCGELQAELEVMRPYAFLVSTWEQKQGPLLAAVALEQNILNILLFFIIAVAGFGILAIFSMIVVEKTRDIGILKALGASTSGVRDIFLGYGLSLGLVGSGVGMIGGLLFVRYINDIEALLSKATGRKVFDDTIYYFDSIPTLVEPWTVASIVGGALLIAVAASVWPASRAARLHPVRALRYE